MQGERDAMLRGQFYSPFTTVKNLVLRSVNLSVILPAIPLAYRCTAGLA